MRPVTRDRDHLDPDRSRVDPAAARRARRLSALALAAAADDVRGADDRLARMTITGRVLDPSGKPVPDAAVMVIVQSKQSDRPMFNRAVRPMTAHQGRCDGSGRFRIELPRTSSARDDAITVTALAPGFALGWAGLDLDADAPTAELALSPEQVIRGRLFDVQGQPARGVAIAVQVVSRFTSTREGLPERTSHPDSLLASPSQPACMARPGDQRRRRSLHPARTGTRAPDRHPGR